MNCPNDVSKALLEILRTSVLRIRNAANANESERCAIEADHVHNIPQLLLDFRPELLDHYWHTERVAYTRQVSAEDSRAYELPWQTLSRHVSKASGDTE